MRSGGRYAVDPQTGKRRLTERTAEHPEGNRARPAEKRPKRKPKTKE